MNKLKAVGLALVAVFAMSAVAASAAQGSVSVTPEKYPAYLTADLIGTARLTPNGGAPALECSAVGGHSTIKEKGVGDTEGTATNITYSGCQTSLGQPMTVEMKGCDYVGHGGTEDVANYFTEGLVDLVCPKGITGPVAKIWATAKAHTENKAPVCTLTISNATNLSGITAINTPASGGIPNDFDVKTSVTTSITAAGVLCSEVTSAVYEGEATVTAFEDKGVEANGNPIEGARVGVTLSKGA